MLKLLCLFALLCGALVASSPAQIPATTADGRAVLLKADGTWLYADSARADTVFDLRRTRWGMSREAVRAAENSAPADSTSDAITWADTLSGMACTVSYVFVDDKLAAARYTITEPRENKNVYLGDFNDLKQALTAKYGKPVSSKMRWLNDNYKGNPQYWGLAVSMGHMTQMARWESPRSDVLLSLAGAEFRVLLTIDYTGRALKAEAAKSAQQKSAKDF